ncbi:MAG: tyrosine-type recombinase/integrase [Candidatus Thorarchaeota archaeon]
MIRPSNEEIIGRFLNHYRASKQSVNVRKSSLRYFFGEKYFHYEGHAFDINKRDLVDYFDYLNHKEDISLKTKMLRWAMIKSFLNFAMEYYDDFFVRIPKNTVKWKRIHKDPNSNKNTVLTIEEVKKILDYLKLHNYQYYLIFRILAETGMRKGGLLNINCDKVNVEKRFIETQEKSGKVIYYTSKELAKMLEIYLKERKRKNTDSNALFISMQLKRYHQRAFNKYLNGQVAYGKVVYKGILQKVGINKHVTCHTFRRTLNTLRKVMGCSNEDRKILLNHKVRDVNVESYLKLNYMQYIELFDNWNPFQDVQL